MVRMLTPQASASESLASQLITMTWSKVHTSTVVVNPTAPSIADGKQYERWVEIFSWMSARGWVITEADTNVAGNQYNYFRLEKTVTSYEGLVQTYRWNMKLVSSNSSSTATWFNGSNAPLNNIGPSSISLATLTSPWPADGVIEMWQSDQDSDSYLLVSRYSIGSSLVRGFMPGANSLRVSDASFSSVEGCFVRVVYPLFTTDQVIAAITTGNKSQDMAFGEISHLNTIRALATPVITHGELAIHDTDVIYHKWRQADVSTLETPANAEKRWNPNDSTVVNTRVIDGTYYIQLGDPSGYAVALLDCGAVNPNLNA